MSEIETLAQSDLDQKSSSIEQKSWNCEIKVFDDEEDKGVFTALASTFGNEDLVADVIEKGAFRKTIRDAKRTHRMPKLLSQHDTTKVVGLITGMKETDEGLVIDGQFIDTTLGRDSFVESSGYLLMRLEPHRLQKHFLALDDEATSATRSSPCNHRNPAELMDTFVLNAAPCHLLHLVQWQWVNCPVAPRYSYLTLPQRHSPLSFATTFLRQDS